MSLTTSFPKLSAAISAFNAAGQVGPDPLGSVYAERRKQHSLFSNLLSDQDLEALRPYLFCHGGNIAQRPGDRPTRVTNLIAGAWSLPAKGEMAVLQSLADRRIPLMEVPASTQEDVEKAVAAATAAWKSLSWAQEVFTYRKHVVKNWSRMLDYFTEDCLREIRQQIPKTRLEAQKDFFEAKRAADHLEGSAEAAIQGELLPPMTEGHTYWRNAYLPAGVSVIISPMNFIYGIPGIHLIGAYLAGVPFIYKGHPFAALSNTTMVRMLLAAGADPALRPEGGRLRRRHRVTGHRRAGGGGGRHRLLGDGTKNSKRPWPQPPALRGRRLQLVLGGRRLLRGRAEANCGAPHLFQARASALTSAPRCTAWRPRPRRSTSCSASSTRRWGRGAWPTPARPPTTRW